MTAEDDNDQKESDALTSDQKKLLEEIVSELPGAMSEAAKRFVGRVLRHGEKILRGRRLKTKGFEERLYTRWAIPLDLYELCLYIAHSCGGFFNRHFRPPDTAGTNDYKFETLVRLQGGAVRVAGEVYTLMLSGYASGAHARWRTLHEIAVVALFIAQEDKKTAERYVYHRFVKSHEDALKYQEHAARLGEKPLTAEEMHRIEQNYKAVLQRFGNDFRHSYGWAYPALFRHNPHLKGAKVGFEHLQAAVKNQHWNSYHRMASHAVHPSATSIRFILGTREEKPFILAGPNNAGLADPGQGALLSLTNATAALMTYEPPSHDIKHFKYRLSLSAMVAALSPLSGIACDQFIKVHQELEDEIRSEADKGDLAENSSED